jgi:hypothetical protein
MVQLIQLSNSKVIIYSQKTEAIFYLVKEELKFRKQRKYRKISDSVHLNSGKIIFN